MSALLVALALAAAEPHAAHAHPQLGKVDFQSSCSAAARPRLERALGWLHSFEYDEAEREFERAAAADPGCGIAHWGVAMSQYHPLWAPPGPAELAKGKAALAKARAAGLGSARERDYVAALETFFADAGRRSHKARTLAYTDRLGQLAARYPGDNEAAIFHALALIAVGTMDDDPSYARELRAAATLNRVLAKAPDHPGVAHYLIHGYDYPALAHLALPAARRYAGIAPASAHAQHMPSHIFIRLGLWEEAIQSNLAAEAAARAYATAQKMPGAWDERLHAMDYLMYGYLQTAQDGEARRILDELAAITRVDPPNFKVAYAATAIPARYVLERRQWADAAALALAPATQRLVPLAKFPWAEAHLHFARAVGAARSGDAKLAREATARLAAIEGALKVAPGEYDWRQQVAIERQVADAWTSFAEGRKDEALAAMRAAADRDDAAEKHPVTPGALLPAREQLGELLLELGQPAPALAAFTAALKQTPRRPAALYGAARAAHAAGDEREARRLYAELLEVTRKGDRERPELKEATAFLAAASTAGANR